MPSLSIKLDLTEYGKGKAKRYRAKLGGFDVEGTKEEIEAQAFAALAACKPQVCLVRVGEGLRVHVASFDGVETLRPRDDAPLNGLIPLQHIGSAAPDKMAREVSSSLLGFAQDSWKETSSDAPPDYLKGAEDRETFAAWTRASRERAQR